MVYLPTFAFDFHGIHVGKYPMDALGYYMSLEMIFGLCFILKINNQGG